MTDRIRTTYINAIEDADWLVLDEDELEEYNILLEELGEQEEDPEEEE